MLLRGYLEAVVQHVVDAVQGGGGVVALTTIGAVIPTQAPWQVISPTITTVVAVGHCQAATTRAGAWYLFISSVHLLISFYHGLVSMNYLLVIIIGLLFPP